MSEDYNHISVLVDEVIEFLAPQKNQNFIDLTLGGGGHSKAILEKTGRMDREISPEEKNKSIDDEDKKITDTIESSASKSTNNTPRTKTVVDIGGLKNVGLVKKTGSIFTLIGLYFKTIGSIFTYLAKKIKYAWLFLFSPKFRQKKEEKT